MPKPEIRVAKSAGFCFGVDRAVTMCRELLASGKKIATLGQIIHNRQLTDELESQGARRVEDLSEVLPGELLVIRSHGAERSVYEECSRRGIEIADATCPYVAKIHNIVSSQRGKTVIIIGDSRHPEVMALVGHCDDNALIFADCGELRAADLSNYIKKPTIMVAQTTYNLLQYKECVDYAKSVFADLTAYDTVCGATRERQREAVELAKESDCCFVIGDLHSSNTRKLREVCAPYCKTYLVETADQLTGEMLAGCKRIGVTAGASAPDRIIEEVLTHMSDIIMDEEAKAQVEETEQPASESEELNFEEAVEQYLKRASRNQRYVGVVTSVLPSEVIVDIGTKQTGVVPADEMTDEPNAKLDEIVKKGDKLNLVAIKVNDQEGIVTLSKKRLDAIDGFSAVTKAAADGTVLEAFVTEKVNAGIIAYYKGVRIFVHESQATLHKGESYDDLIKTNVRLKITDVRGPHSVRGSIRRVLLDERDSRRDEFWKTVENGKKYKGVVKSLTSYGAFVDLGGVDGMIHISELSWGRIKHPSDVVKVGDEVEVYVKNADAENRKISLGFRKEEDNPWNRLRDVPVGTIFEGPIVSLVKYGAFIRIMPNLDGFCHISEISNTRIEKPSDVLRNGQTVQARLLGVDFDRQRISLSLRDENGDPLPREELPEAPKAAETEPAEEKTEQSAE